MVYFERQRIDDGYRSGSGFNPCSNGWCTSSLMSRMTSAPSCVSILVLMDGVLRVASRSRLTCHRAGFNPCSNGWCTSRKKPDTQYIQSIEVSILVLMDGVLRGQYILTMAGPSNRFNPCSNGWCTSRARCLWLRWAWRCFNPCSNGWCTSSCMAFFCFNILDLVSILVLMDGVLRADFDLVIIPVDEKVSILVLMDGVLRDVRYDIHEPSYISFNPCSNGWCTSSRKLFGYEVSEGRFQSLF